MSPTRVGTRINPGEAPLLWRVGGASGGREPSLPPYGPSAQYAPLIRTVLTDRNQVHGKT